MASEYFSAAVSLQTAELQNRLQMLIAVSDLCEFCVDSNSDLCEFCVESNVMLLLCCRLLLEQAGVASPAWLAAVVCCKNAW